MPPTSGPHGSGRDPETTPGRHLLGPHVVGQRVVVRRLVPDETGPTGGPAFTDLLGTCLAWSEDGCLVQREDGTNVLIPLGLIVSGKPVPPRPSVRGRVSAREAELRVAGLWADVEIVDIGEWQLRSQPVVSGRMVKRANSCLAFGDPGVPMPAALEEVRRFYTGRGRPVLVQAEEGGDAEAAARAAGWVDLDPPMGNELRLGSLSQVRRALRAARRATGVTVELSATGRRATASIGTGCDPYAEASATLDRSTGAGGSGDWVGLHTVAVEPAYRRRGLATALVGELLGWAAEQGAMSVWVQVEPGNAAATALWDGLGLAPHHRSQYLTAPPA